MCAAPIILRMTLSMPENEPPIPPSAALLCAVRTVQPVLHTPAYKGTGETLSPFIQLPSPTDPVD